MVGHNNNTAANELKPAGADEDGVQQGGVGGGAPGLGDGPARASRRTAVRSGVLIGRPFISRGTSPR
jgi:hypothetical protein